MGTSDTPSRVFMVSAPIASTVAFVITCFFNYLGAQDANNLELGIFNNDTGSISDKYYLEITPAGWTFSIWGFIYTYQAILLVYWLTLLCRKNPATSEPLYRSPVFMTPWIAVFYVLNMALNIGWMFAWDREEIPVAFVVLSLVTITLYICMALSFYGLSKNKYTMLNQELDREIRLVIGIVHNGLGMYATWTSIATLLNFSMVLHYEEDIGVEQHIASSIGLSLLAFEIVAFMFIDHILLERHTRYLFTPYIVLIVALIGSIDKNWDSDNSNSIFTAALLTIVGFASIMKIILVIYRSRRYPLYEKLDSFTNLIKPTTS